MSQPWKTYLVGVLIIGLLIGAGVGWLVKPAVEVPGPTVTNTVTTTVTTTVTAPPTPVTPTPPTPTPPVTFEGVTLTVATQPGPFIAGPIYHWRDVWYAKTKAKEVRVVEIPYAELFEKMMLDLKVAKTYDIIIYPADWAGDIMGGGYVLPLTDFMKTRGFPDWEDVAPTVREKILAWGGVVYATPYDGDCHLFYWREDAVEVPEYQDKFYEEYGYRYHIPPKTWEEVRDMAEFFNGWDWDKDGETDYGIAFCFARGSQTPWYFIDLAAQYSVMPPEEPGELSKYRGIFYFDIDTMEPLVNTPGFIEGLKMFKELLNYAPPGAITWTSGDVRTIFVAKTPSCALAVDWADIGVMQVDPAISKVKDKVGYSRLPGASKVWDREKGVWVEKFNQISIFNFGGWIASISKWCKNPDAAYDLITFLASPDVDIHDVSEGARKTGRNPYRYSHFERVDAWVTYGGWSADEAEEYLAAIKGVYDDPNALTDIRIPGQPKYWDALDIAISEVLAGTKTPEDAAAWLYDEWVKTTEEYGKDTQLKLYREMLGLPPK